MRIYDLNRSMRIHEDQQEMISKNLAGIQLPGYKSQGFSVEAGYLKKSGAGKAHSRLEQGSVKQTGRSLDFAINGEGFFAVQDQNGKLFYTRNGNFRLNANGQIQNTSGAKVLDINNQPLSVPLDKTGELVVSKDGQLSFKSGAQVEKLGKIQVAIFDNPSELKRETASTFSNPERLRKHNAGPDESSILGSSLEQSNSNAIFEMTDMINNIRQYEMLSRMIKNGTNLSSREFQTLG